MFCIKDVTKRIFFENGDPYITKVCLNWQRVNCELDHSKQSCWCCWWSTTVGGFLAKILQKLSKTICCNLPPCLSNLSLSLTLTHSLSRSHSLSHPKWIVINKEPTRYLFFINNCQETFFNSKNWTTNYFIKI